MTKAYCAAARHECSTRQRPLHSMQALEPGGYFFNRERNTLELLKEGEFRAEAYHLGLEQELPGDACVGHLFVADLELILDRYGNRGYRASSWRRALTAAGSVRAAPLRGLPPGVHPQFPAS